MNKIKFFHFHNGSGGGVLSVIKNLIRFSNNVNIEHHVIYTINKSIISNYLIEEIDGASSQQLFYYSPFNNFYHTSKQLAHFLPDNKAIIIAHDWLELGMAGSLGLQNPVVQFLHGDYSYYYDLAKKNAGIINLFIPVANNIKSKLLVVLNNRKNNIQYFRFPVPEAFGKNLRLNSINIIFIGRLSKDKGFDILPEIALKLIQNGLQVNWHIIGEDDIDSANLNWDTSIEVKFYGAIKNEEVLKILPKMTYLLLPSKFEGMPVVLIEAMKAGVIPLVSDIDGGIQEIVVNNYTGFKLAINDTNGYANILIDLNKDIPLKNALSYNCIEQANKLFDPYINTLQIENYMISSLKSITIKKPFKVYGSRLDSCLIPNFITLIIRKYLNKK